MKDRPRVHDFDWTLLAIVGAISGFGVAEIYSSTHASGMAGMQYRQLIWIAVGIAGMFLISRIDYHTLLDQAPAPLRRRDCHAFDRFGDRPIAIRGQDGGSRWAAAPICKCQN